jgi:lipopolysaccharide/colanic/teichoic acid biosynthesis glycosyltransferase
MEEPRQRQAKDSPRPTLIEQVNRYSKEHRRRLEVKPGITGWALVNGRNILSWSEKIELDIWYIDHWSLFLDLKMLFNTIWVVVFTRKVFTGKMGIQDIFRIKTTII